MENTVVNITEHMSKLMDIEDLIVDIVSEELSISEDKINKLFSESNVREKMYAIGSDYFKIGWANLYHEFIIESADKLNNIQRAIEVERAEKRNSIGPDNLVNTDISPEMNGTVTAKGIAVNSSKIASLSLGTKLRRLFAAKDKNQI